MENQIENMIAAVLNSDELTVHNNSSGNGDLNSSDDDDAPKVRSKKVKRFSDSESETDHSVLKRLTDSDKSKASDSEEEMIKSVPQKSRIKMISNESSDSEGPKTEEVVKNAEQQLRMKNKRNKIRDKFKSLVSSRGKDGMKDNEKEINEELDHSGCEKGSVSEDSDQASSIDNLKKKIKERMSSFKSSVCDPDTSDEEEQQVIEYKQKKPRKTKPTSPKPQRMSAKQAMENMNKIKSESNRMLREKEVSLPYHRPKALSLKDIMSRRQPALAANGKALPIKMNEDQLREYAKMLEERQKKMAELWQSDNEDDENDDEAENNVNTLKTDENQENTVENPENPVVAVENPEINSGIADNNEMTKQTTTNITEPSEITKDNFNDSDRNFDEVIQEHNSTITSQAGNISKDIEMETEEQDSETNLTLHYNDSETSNTEEKNSPAKENSNKSQELDMKQLDNSTETEEVIKDLETSKTSDADKNILEVTKLHSETEKDSQLISLHFDSEIKNGGEEINDSESSIEKGVEIESVMRNTEAKESKAGDEIESMDVDGFSDGELNMDDIDNIIENAEIIKEIEDKVNSPLLIRDRPLNVKPKLTGAPGMVIDLDGSSAALPRKSGVQLLKERYCFFSKLKTPEEKERERELKSKPGTLHLKLKHDLEEKMAEQRSLEWAKRLDEEKQQQDELKLLRGEESDDENDIDKIEAKLEEKEGEEQAEELQDNEDNEDEDLEEEELVEDDCDMNDKPRSSNPMIEDQAEESECDETEDKEELDGEDAQDDDNDDDSESDDTSSSEEEEEEQTTRKGRILKAFEDSDEEDAKETEGVMSEVKEVSGTVENILESQGGSQDDIIQLAQKHKSGSEDLFTTQETTSSQAKDTIDVETSGTDIDIGTQSFSIMDSTKDSAGIDLNNSGSLGITTEVNKCNNLAAISSVRLDNLSQSMPPLPIPMTQISQSQPIGEDILALCTGNFYDNQFVSPAAMNPPTQELTQSFNSFDDETQKEGVKGEESLKEGAKEGDSQKGEEIEDKSDGVEKLDAPNFVNRDIEDDDEISNTIELKTVLKDKVVDDNLKSILDELHDPEFDSPKPNKFFVGNKSGSQADNHRKKFIIDSDDENNDFVSEQKKRKKIKKKKLEKRALQISDDEDESDPVQEEYESEIEEEDPERVVEYDSEENEIALKPQSHKKKRKVAEFFEKEAELTSEDEWVGSGDEDEAGLDRLEREAGDDDCFHHARLQRELGLIHMRDVLDQDKREVRIIQELLFEDGDLGGEGRQRKFRWKDNDGVGEDGGNLGDFGDTQEEEFESEEQWRKQRHEREMFLRQMKTNEDQSSSLNVSINRTSIIKANLSSRTMSSLLMEVNPTKTEAKTDSPAVEKKTAKDIPSPKKSFGLLQHNYQGSILKRGQGAIARLAALATPLADDDNPKIGSLAPSSKRNFVFAALTPDEKPKVTKRKAENNPITPKLVKKMRTEEKKQKSKNSLLDHLKL